MELIIGLLSAILGALTVVAVRQKRKGRTVMCRFCRFALLVLLRLWGGM